MAQGALSGEAAELRRPEDRPAVVNLLVHGGRTTGDAFAATLFELAARGALHVEEVGDAHAFRVRREAPELLVRFDHVIGPSTTIERHHPG